MADKVYRLKDVPKGQKVQYFFDYYTQEYSVALSAYYAASRM